MSRSELWFERGIWADPTSLPTSLRPAQICPKSDPGHDGELLLVEQRDAHHVEAAVDVDGLAGHRARQVGSQPQCRLADVLGADVRAQWRNARERAVQLPEVAHTRCRERPNRTGRDRIHANTR